MALTTLFDCPRCGEKYIPGFVEGGPVDKCPKCGYEPGDFYGDLKMSDVEYIKKERRVRDLRRRMDERLRELAAKGRPTKPSRFRCYLSVFYYYSGLIVAICAAIGACILFGLAYDSSYEEMYKGLAAGCSIIAVFAFLIFDDSMKTAKDPLNYTRELERYNSFDARQEEKKRKIRDNYTRYIADAEADYNRRFPDGPTKEGVDALGRFMVMTLERERQERDRLEHPEKYPPPEPPELALAREEAKREEEERAKIRELHEKADEFVGRDNTAEELSDAYEKIARYISDNPKALESENFQAELTQIKTVLFDRWMEKLSPTDAVQPPAPAIPDPGEDQQPQ